MHLFYTTECIFGMPSGTNPFSFKLVKEKRNTCVHIKHQIGVASVR